MASDECGWPFAEVFFPKRIFRILCRVRQVPPVWNKKSANDSGLGLDDFCSQKMLILGAIFPNRFIAHLNGIRLECADRLDMWLILVWRNVGQMTARLMCDRFMCELSRCCVAKCRCNFGENVRSFDFYLLNGTWTFFCKTKVLR